MSWACIWTQVEADVAHMTAATRRTSLPTRRDATAPELGPVRSKSHLKYSTPLAESIRSNFRRRHSTLSARPIKLRFHRLCGKRSAQLVSSRLNQQNRTQTDSGTGERNQGEEPMPEPETALKTVANDEPDDDESANP